MCLSNDEFLYPMIMFIPSHKIPSCCLLHFLLAECLLGSSAVGNFSVQYNFQSIAICLIIMSVSQCTLNDKECKEGEQAGWVASTATATVFIGAMTGQLLMGYVGDVLGRNAAMTLTLSMVVVGALSSAVVSYGSATAVYIVVIISRFVLGIGVGGVYPLSATKASEDGGDSKGITDPSAAAWAFFWQVPGSMVSSSLKRQYPLRERALI